MHRNSNLRSKLAETPAALPPEFFLPESPDSIFFRCGIRPPAQAERGPEETAIFRREEENISE